MEPDEPPSYRIVIIETRSKTAISEVLGQLGWIDQAPRINIERAETVTDNGDIFLVSGQAGAVGPNAKSEGDSFTQIAKPDNSEVDAAILALQLSIIRAAMKRQSSDAPSAAQDDEIGHVARAEIAAGRGDSGGAFAHLKQAGAWTLKVAQETGAEIIALFLAHLTQG